jgi:hypothetical protein
MLENEDVEVLNGFRWLNIGRNEDVDILNGFTWLNFG